MSRPEGTLLPCDCAVSRAASSTFEVRIPMSGVSRDHWYQPAAIASRELSLVSESPWISWAAARMMTIAIAVSSVHSPGFQPSCPPPVMATSSESAMGGSNS